MPVRSASDRPFSKRVSRRSGAGPGSLAQSGDEVCVVCVAPTLPPHPSAPSASADANANANATKPSRLQASRFKSARVTSNMLDLPF